MTRDQLLEVYIINKSNKNLLPENFILDENKMKDIKYNLSNKIISFYYVIDSNEYLFEHRVGTGILDSLYFTVVTISTVGFGDISSKNTFLSRFIIRLMLMTIIAFEFIDIDIYNDLSDLDKNNCIKIHAFLTLFILPLFWGLIHFLFKDVCKNCYKKQYQVQDEKGYYDFWNFWEYAYVIRSTVGFGNVFPNYPTGKIVTILNILFNLLGEKWIISKALKLKFNKGEYKKIDNDDNREPVEIDI